VSVIVEVIEHITVDGDRWDNLAWQYYGDANDYERIISANPEVLIIPILPGGIRLLIPVIEEDETESTTELPPWKQ